MKVVEFLKQRNVPFEIVPHPQVFDAQHLAESLHVRGREVAKTVLLRADRGYMYVVAVLPATKRVDLQKLSHAFGDCKMELATEVEIHDRCPDCEMGVLPPFGTPFGMKAVVDESLAMDEEIYFEGDTHHEAIRMKYADFQEVERPVRALFAV